MEQCRDAYGHQSVNMSCCERLNFHCSAGQAGVVGSSLPEAVDLLQKARAGCRPFWPVPALLAPFLRIITKPRGSKDWRLLASGQNSCKCSQQFLRGGLGSLSAASLLSSNLIFLQVPRIWKVHNKMSGKLPKAALFDLPAKLNLSPSGRQYCLQHVFQCKYLWCLRHSKLTNTFSFPVRTRLHPNII